MVAARRSTSSSESSVVSAYGESFARFRISFDHARPMPASARWSRRNGCRRRASRRAISASSPAVIPTASGPRMGQLGLQLVGPVDADARPLLGASLGEDQLAAVLQSQPERRRLGALRAGLQEADAPGAHQVHVEDELAVVGGEEGACRAAGPRRTAGPRGTRAAGRTSSGWPRAPAPLWRPGRARSARRASAAPPPSGNSGIVFLLVDALNVAVTRGQLVESRHHAHAVVVQDGDVVEAWGDPELVAFVRSAAKPCRRFRSSLRPAGGGARDRLRVARGATRTARRRAGADGARRRGDGRPRVRRRARLAAPPQLLGQARGLPLPLPRARLGDRGLPAARASAPAGAPGARRRDRGPARERAGDGDRRLRRADVRALARRDGAHVRGLCPGRLRVWRPSWRRSPRTPARRRAAGRGHAGHARGAARRRQAGAEGVLCVGLPNGRAWPSRSRTGPTGHPTPRPVRCSGSPGWRRALRSSRGDEVGTIAVEG